MSMTRWRHTVAALVSIAVCRPAVPPAVSTQSRAPVQAAGGEAATRGEAWFYQHRFPLPYGTHRQGQDV